MSGSLRLFNTMSGKKEVFRPLTPGRVSMFVCGPTVQSDMHLGHARTYVFYDVVARYLSHLGYSVNYLMNITDFDERITQAAVAAKQEPLALAGRYDVAFRDDMRTLKCTSVTRFEPVSKHVETMINQVKTLLETGYAYAVGGWVYFDTSKSRNFGKLSHQSRRELSLRPLELSPQKRHLPDFALWRPEVLLEGKWRSPWGLGSPGWHIQDTSVTLTRLGPRYDIHGGAYELVYPHHEAEIAQAEALTGVHPFVRYWVHTHHVNMEGRKMSKSLGNVVTVREALKSYTADELRFFLLSTHYRDDMDLSGISKAAKRLRDLKRLAGAIARAAGSGAAILVGIAFFESAMNDDIDTPRAIDSIESRLKRANRERSARAKSAGLAQAASAMGLLGVELIGRP
jgi:cysteinyl-tRNA synthetase